jgi:hypothetical protein
VKKSASVAAVVASLLVLWAVSFSESPSLSAKQRFADLRKSVHEAREQNAWPAYLHAARELNDFLNGSPSSLLEAAHAELKLGHLDQARAEAQHVLDMGQAPNVLLTEPFAGLHDLAGAVAANQVPVSKATLVWELADSGLLPEDIDYDSRTRRFLVTSVLEKKIVVLDRSGKAHDFAQSPEGWPMLAIKVDEKHRRLWATEVALENFSIVSKSDWGRSMLLSFDLDTGKLLSKIEGPAHSALGDMVLRAKGVPIVADGDGGGIYQLRNSKILDRLDGGDFISPQTPTLDADGKHLFVPDYLRGIGILDLSTRKVRWLPMENKFALDGIDGLYLRDRTLLAVQNGTSPERVSEFTLDDLRHKVIGQHLIESATTTLGDPTHGVIVGNDFYYIANSGWDVLDEHGERKAGAKPTPARIMRTGIQP